MTHIKQTTFTVDSQDNLIAMGFFSRIHYKFSSSYRTEVDAKVQAAALRSLNVFTGHEDQSGIRDFFRRNIAPISTKQFDRSAIKSHEIYDRIKASLINNDPIAGRAEDKVNEVWDAWAEGQIADWAGLNMKRNDKGTSGNYRVKNLDGKTIGIFKPLSESPHGSNNPHTSIRIRNFFQRLFQTKRCYVEEKSPEAEEFASVMSTVFNSKLVPETRKVQLISDSFVTQSSEVGSFQLFIPDAVDGFKLFGIKESLPSWMDRFFLPKTDEKTAEIITEEEFIEFALLQYFHCNVDCNWGNMMKGSRLHSIDNGNGMPEEHPNSFLDLRNLHISWSKISYAKKPITLETFQKASRAKETLLTKFDRVYGNDEKSLRIKARFEERMNFFIMGMYTDDLSHTWLDLVSQHFHG